MFWQHASDLYCIKHQVKWCKWCSNLNLNDLIGLQERLSPVKPETESTARLFAKSSSVAVDSHSTDMKSADTHNTSSTDPTL